MRLIDAATILVLCLLLALVPDSLTGEDGIEDSSRPYVAWAGETSHIGTQCALLAENESDWIDIWLRHKGIEKKRGAPYDTFYNPAGLPHVNFKKCMVVALFEGKCWNCAGLMPCSIDESGDVVSVRFEKRSYQTVGPNGGGRKSAPFGIFVIPRSDRTVVVEQKVLQLKNSPPVWKERTRIER